MKFFVSMCIVVVAVLFSFCAVSEAAVGRAIFSNPDNPGKCTINSDLILSPGESAKAPNNPCASVQCMEGSLVEFRTCPAVPPPQGCKLRDFVNVDRAYPECCERTYDCTSSFLSSD